MIPVTTYSLFLYIWDGVGCLDLNPNSCLTNTLLNVDHLIKSLLITLPILLLIKRKRHFTFQNHDFIFNIKKGAFAFAFALPTSILLKKSLTDFGTFFLGFGKRNQFQHLTCSYSPKINRNPVLLKKCNILFNLQ